MYECGKVSQLRFKISNIIGSISTCSTLDSSEKQKDFIIVPAIYEQYHKARNELCKDLLNLDHMSTYNPENIEFEKHKMMGPMTGYFDNDDICTIKYSGLDTRKAYTSLWILKCIQFLITLMCGKTMMIIK